MPARVRARWTGEDTDEMKLDELNRLHDLGKLDDDDYHALVRGEVAKPTRHPMSARKHKMLIGGAVAVAVLAVVVYVTVVGLRPWGMSDAAYKAGCEAVQVGEDYKAGKLSRHATEDRLSGLADSMRTEMSDLPSDATSDTNPDVRICFDIINMNGNLVDLDTLDLGDTPDPWTPGSFGDNFAKLKKDLG